MKEEKKCKIAFLFVLCLYSTARRKQIAPDIQQLIRLRKLPLLFFHACFHHYEAPQFGQSCNLTWMRALLHQNEM